MLNQSLHERFNNAERILQECRDNIPENLRMKLYGLSKQAKEGDCRMPMPPSSNAVLRAKWDAWTAYAGMENEKAMLEFNSLIDRLDVSTSPRDAQVDKPSQGAIRRTSLKPGQMLMKQGTLYKQRDHFKGWRPRQFVLIDNTLSYYIDGEDSTPRGSLVLTGCTCEEATPTMADGVEYFHFTLTHPGNSKPYHLSALSKVDADDWIAKINQAAKVTDAPNSASKPAMRRTSFTNTTNTPASVDTPTAVSDSAKYSKSSQNVPFQSNNASNTVTTSGVAERESTADDSADAGAATTGTAILKPEATVKNLPAHLKDIVESKILEMFDAVSPGAPGWEIFMDKDGVKGLKRPGKGDVSAIRADCTMPYNILDVFQTVTSAECCLIMDPMRKQQDVLKVFSNHTWVDYLRFKEIWPISARDFVNFVHWRLRADGTIVILAFSSKFDDLKPPQQGLVRGDTTLAGYILKPNKSTGGTDLHFLVESDPKGSLPTSIVNQVNQAQPKAIIIAKQLLEKKKASNSLLRSASATVSYQDFVGVVTANISGTATGSGSSTGASASGSGSAAVPLAPANGGPTSSVSAPATGLAAMFPSVSGAGSGSSSSGAVSNIAKSEAVAAVSHRLHDIKGHEYVLFVFLVPVALYYTIGGYSRSVAFIAAFIFAAKYLLRQHMGTPMKRSTHSLTFTQVPAGRMLVRIPVDLGQLLKYLDSKRSDSKIEVTITHITLKACAAVITEMPTLNGHMMLGDFYPTQSGGVDVSYSLDLTDRDSILLKIADADVKSVEAVSNEVIGLSKKTREDTKRPPKASLKTKLLDMLSPSMSEYVDRFLIDLGQQYGISLPALGIEAFPAGVCSVITSPSMEGDADVEVSVVPSSAGTDYAAPIVVSIGSVRILPGVDAARSIVGTPVLNYSISFDNRAASIVEARKFCAKLQKYLRNPALLEAKPAPVAPAGENPTRRKSFLK